jgi:SAM-dependent methyltransferase
MTDAIKQNEHIYDRLWAKLPIPTHTEWPIWSELQKEIHSGSRLLEMGAGVLPRIPVEGGYFVDLSQAALRKLDVFGGHGVRAAGPLPFCDGAFDVVCAFEVLEHIPDDETVLHELSRVLRPGGALFFSVPVDPALWTGFDDACGHVRRYVASDLAARLANTGLTHRTLDHAAQQVQEGDWQLRGGALTSHRGLPEAHDLAQAQGHRG